MLVSYLGALTGQGNFVRFWGGVPKVKVYNTTDPKYFMKMFPLFYTSSSSFSHHNPWQLSQLCTILGPLHDPGPLSRVLWDIFTGRVPHAGLMSPHFFLLEYFLLELHIHRHIVGLISLLTFFPRTRLSVQFRRITVRRLENLDSIAVSVYLCTRKLNFLCNIK